MGCTLSPLRGSFFVSSDFAFFFLALYPALARWAAFLRSFGAWAAATLAAGLRGGASGLAAGAAADFGVTALPFPFALLRIGAAGTVAT